MKRKPIICHFSWTWGQMRIMLCFLKISELILKTIFREINSKVMIKQATSSLTFYSWSENSRNFDFWIYAYKKNKGEKITCHLLQLHEIFLQIGEFHPLWQNCQLWLKNKNSHFNYSVQVWYLNYSEGDSFMKWIYFWLLPKSGKKNNFFYLKIFREWRKLLIRFLNNS